MSQSLLPADVSIARQKLQPYPTYRRSEVWGVPSLPSHWHEKPLKHLVAINTDKLPETTDPEYDIEYVDIGNVNLERGITSSEQYRFEKAPSRARRKVRHGDTVVSTVRTYLKAVAQVINPPENLIVSTGFAVLRAKPPLHPGFLYRLAQSEPLVERTMAHSVGVSYPAINAAEIGQFTIPLPPHDEQRSIAAFLDQETARVDELIRLKEAMLGRLAERRAHFLNNAVTCGIAEPSGTMPTDILWLPEIPSRWRLKRLKFVAHLQTGLTLGKKYESGTLLVTRPYLRVANVQDGFLDLDHITTVEVPQEHCGRYELRPGDVLLTEGGDFDKLGRGYVWDGQIEGCLHQNHIFSVRPRLDRLMPNFLAAVFTSLHGRNYFTSTAHQTTNLASTNSTKLRAFPVPLPPLEEQEVIMRHITDEFRKLDETSARVSKAIASLRTYRAALITGAVTGQIDVREAV